MLEPSMTSKSGQVQVKSMIEHWYWTLPERMAKNLADTLSILLMRWFRTKVWATLGNIWLVVFTTPSTSGNLRCKRWVVLWMTYTPRSKIWVKKKFKMQSIFSRRSWKQLLLHKGFIQPIWAVGLRQRGNDFYENISTNFDKKKSVLLVKWLNVLLS